MICSVKETKCYFCILRFVTKVFKNEKTKPVLILVLLFSSLFSFAQQGSAIPKIKKITEKVVEKISKQPFDNNYLLNS